MIPESSVRQVFTLWEDNPYRLFTWWDMEQFSGHNLSTALGRMHRVQCTYSQKDPDFILSPETFKDLREELTEVVRQLNSVGLSTSAGVLLQFCVHLLNWKRTTLVLLTAVTWLHGLQRH